MPLAGKHGVKPEAGLKAAAPRVEMNHMRTNYYTEYKKASVDEWGWWCWGGGASVIGGRCCSGNQLQKWSDDIH